MTTINAAPIIASKGHYYDFIFEDMKVKLTDRTTGAEIAPDPQNDDTILIIDKLSGVVLDAYQRMQINMELDNKDVLFSYMKSPILYPITFVSREGGLNDDQINTLLGDLRDAMLIKKVGLIVGLVLGGLLLILGVFFIVRCCLLKKAI